MRTFAALAAGVALSAALALGFFQARKLIYAQDGSGVYGYKDTPPQPWSGWLVHDPDRPRPPRVDGGEFSTQKRAGRAPSDAIVLFDGRDLSHWHQKEWRVRDGYAVTDGVDNLISRQEFGDFQLHIEWQVPNPPTGGLMDMGNSGINVMDFFEIQIFDSISSKIYADGQAASIYGQTPPLVDAQRKPGAWEVFDIVVLAPVFVNGELKERARVTMFHNGLLVHHNQEVYGGTMHRLLPSAYTPGKTKGPIVIKAHKNPVKFRNIWVRPLQLR